MSSLIAAELLKLRTTRSFWVIVGLTLLLVTLTTVIQLATDVPGDEGEIRSMISNVSLAGLFMLILGTVDAAGEYRHGTITPTLLVAPDRRRVLLAQAAAHAVAGLLLALASAVVVLGLALPWLSSVGESPGSLGLSSSELLGLLASLAAYVVITGMLGVVLGALLANQVAAFAVVPAILIVIDPLLIALVDGFGRWSLGGLWSSLTNGRDDAGFATFSPLPAALVYFAYIAALAAITAAISQRRDVG